MASRIKELIGIDPHNNSRSIKVKYTHAPNEDDDEYDMQRRLYVKSVENNVKVFEIMSRVSESTFALINSLFEKF
uniref:Uncharacterized protein n=1 Tax=viral metagenome TaxID=1070528 RepID=A0A6C0E8C1_9ZZZZ